MPREQHGYVDGLPFVQRWDFSAAGVRRSVEDSLRRLGLSRLGVAYVHDCDAITHGADASEILGEHVPWEKLFAALLSVLLRKHLIADWEFVEEFKKI